MTYTSSDQLRGRTLSREDVIIFEVDGAKIGYIVCSAFLFNSCDKPNDYIFKILDIEDKASFCKECYKYEPHHGYKEEFFPECKAGDFKALTSVAFALLKLCEEKKYKDSKEESLYKKGDVVTIKKEYDKGCGPEDYPCFFSSYLLNKFGGKTGYISEVLNCSDRDRKLYLEPFCYILNIDGQRHTIAFSAPMFETKSKIIQDEDFFTFTDSDIPNNYPYNYAILDLSIQEDKNQHPNLTLLECFNRCISASLCALFLFKSSIMGNDFWVKVVENADKSYIPKMYKPKYYSPSSLLKEDANSNKTLTSNLDYNNGLDKSSFKKEFKYKKLNISIPCSYEEVKLSIKKLKIKF